MVSDSRAFRSLLVAALVAAAIFAWESGRGGLWANMALGLVVAGLIAVLLWTSRGERPFRTTWAPEAADPPADPHGLHLLLDQAPMPLVRLAPGGAPEALNRAARTLFQADDVIQTGRDELVAALTRPAPGGPPVVSLAGRRFALSVSEIHSSDGHVRLAALADVEAEMHRAEAAALRDTLHILSHEIMNSLIPAASLAEIADSYLQGETGDGAATAREALEMLSRRTRNLTRFIEAYRSVARLPEPVLQPVAPGRLVDDILGPFRHSASTAGVVFEATIADNLPLLLADEPQLSQAINNVITNAVEAGAGRIVVTVEAGRHSVIIRVSDDGGGIPEEMRGNLFTAFATTKPSGTGTGLNLARQIALAHGGNLGLLDGTPTTFAFTLPVRS